MALRRAAGPAREAASARVQAGSPDEPDRPPRGWLPRCCAASNGPLSVPPLDPPLQLSPLLGGLDEEWLARRGQRHVLR